MVRKRRRSGRALCARAAHRAGNEGEDPQGRGDRVAANGRYLEERRPDVLALQETKCQDHAFPLAELRALGYEAAVAGQKSYNGVAIFSRHPMHNVRIGLAGGEGDSMEPQARYIEADVCGVKICNVYVVNGNPVPSAAFSYRERFLGRLIVHVSRLAALAQPFVLMGDFNCVQHDDQCYDADRMREDAVMHASSRHQFRALCYAAGLYNAQDLHAARSSPALHAQDLLGAGRDLSRCYTYWDYRGGCWPKDLGLRIDHILLHPQVCAGGRVLCMRRCSGGGPPSMAPAAPPGKRTCCLRAGECNARARRVGVVGAQPFLRQEWAPSHSSDGARARWQTGWTRQAWTDGRGAGLHPQTMRLCGLASGSRRRITTS